MADLGLCQQISVRHAFSMLERLGLALLRFSVATFPAGAHCVRDKCGPNKRSCLFTGVRGWSVLGSGIISVIRVIEI